MKHQDGYFEDARDAQIYYQYWLPENKPKAILLIVHGLAEHSGRYMNVVDHFVPAGYGVYGFDHIGHGRSDGARAYVERFRYYTTILQVYLDMIWDWQPELPVFLIGHSMGGLICASYLLEHQEGLTGVVLSGPGIKVPDDISAVTIFMGKMLSIMLPKAGIIKLDPTGISRDRAVVDAYVNDSLVYNGKICARLGAEMLKTMQTVTKSAERIKLPMMIVQGGADKLVDPSGAQMLYDSVSSEDKTLKIYDDLYHEVFNEPDRGKVLGDVGLWIKDHLGKT